MFISGRLVWHQVPVAADRLWPFEIRFVRDIQRRGAPIDLNRLVTTIRLSVTMTSNGHPLTRRCIYMDIVVQSNVGRCVTVLRGP